MSDDRSKQKNWNTATRLVRGGLERSGFSETSEALFMTSGYVYGSAEEAEAAFTGEKPRFVYSRYANPTVAMFQDRLALLEGANHCFATSSGMAAVFAAIACQVKAGERVVAARALFSSCSYILTDILPSFGIETELVDGTDLSAWEAALAKGAKVVFLETPTNPTLEIIDLKAVCQLANDAGARVVVDNVFATPILQRPLDLGAHTVAYSATKHIDGQGRTMGGAILTNDSAFYEDELIPFVRHTGPCMSPFNAWLLLKGLETLDLRVRRQCENAAKIASFLEGRAGIERALYPGLQSHPQHNLSATQMDAPGTMLAFEVAGGKAGAFKVLNRLDIIDISNNLGDAKSLITHPATTTHQRLSDDERAAVGVTDGLIRLSVGLEDADDLIADLDQALA